MRINDWLQKTEKLLREAGIGTARLDSLVLLEDATGKNRAHLLAHPELELTKQQLHELTRQLELRIKHIPLAQIRGKTEFYGREFIINPYVLEPRPESETIIELLNPLAKGKTVITDVGTGSGALAITSALEHPSSKVYATDIDPECLSIAKRNARKHQVAVTFVSTDLMAKLPDEAIADAIIIANLPYVPDDYAVNQAALNEPRIAIFGGSDGLNLYRQLFAQITKRPSKPRVILTESLPFQHTALADLAKEHGYTQTREDDFIQQFELS